MISESELPTGKRMPVRIEGVAGCLEGQDIGIVVLIRWCKRDVNGRTWVIGCSISDENGREVERIIELIYRYTL